MKQLLSLIITLSFFQMTTAQIIKQEDFSIGETIEFKSTILNENRTLNIYLPNSYATDSLKKYPVIYLLDGSKDEDFIHISGLVQFCSFSWINIIEESIVVGISNIDRKKDFTYPSTMDIDKEEFPTSGHSKPFIDFIKNEVQQVIANTYRVRDEKTIIGQSVGGLLATEILFKHPDMFDHYIIVSPSLWWDDEKLLSYKPGKELHKKSVYVGVGKEGPLMERVAQSLFYKLSLEKKNELKLFFGYFEQQSHGDVLHLAVYDAFEKIFKKKEDGK